MIGCFFDTKKADMQTCSVGIICANRPSGQSALVIEIEWVGGEIVEPIGRRAARIVGALPKP